MRFLLIFIIFSLFLRSSSYVIKGYIHKEEIKDLQFQGSDSNQEGIILLHFYRIYNQSNVISMDTHLRIVLANKQVISIKVDYPFPLLENYDQSENQLFVLSNVLNGKYILIKFMDIDKVNGLIVSWNGELVEYVYRYIYIAFYLAIIIIKFPFLLVLLNLELYPKILFLLDTV